MGPDDAAYAEQLAKFRGLLADGKIEAFCVGPMDGDQLTVDVRFLPALREIVLGDALAEFVGRPTTPETVAAMVDKLDRLSKPPAYRVTFGPKCAQSTFENAENRTKSTR